MIVRAISKGEAKINNIKIEQDFKEIELHISLKVYPFEEDTFINDLNALINKFSV